MIISFDTEIAALKPMFAKPETPERNLRIAFELMMILDRGMGAERKRIVGIIQQHGMNPMPLIERINRPLR